MRKICVPKSVSYVKRFNTPKSLLRVQFPKRNTFSPFRIPNVLFQNEHLEIYGDSIFGLLIDKSFKSTTVTNNRDINSLQVIIQID